MRELGQDIRYAARALIKRPGFTAHGISSLDPGTLVATATVLAAVATFAALVPARRALGTPLLEALRHE